MRLCSPNRSLDRKVRMRRFHHRRVMALAICSCLGAAASAVAQSPEKNTGAKATGAAPSAADLEKGKKIYDAQCAICHFSKSTAKKVGPGLKELWKRGKFADGKRVDDDSLRTWIEKGGKNMPGFKDSLSAEQVRALIAYLKTL